MNLSFNLVLLINPQKIKYFTQSSPYKEMSLNNKKNIISSNEMDKSETYYRMQIKKMTKPNLRDREWSTDCHGSGSKRGR